MTKVSAITIQILKDTNVIVNTLGRRSQETGRMAAAGGRTAINFAKLRK